MAEFSLTISAASAADLAAAIAGLAGGTATTAPAADKAPAAKPAVKPAAKAADKPAEEPKAEADAGGETTIDDAKAAMKVYMDANGRDAVIELLGRFGVKNISALPATQFGEFIAECTA